MAAPLGRGGLNARNVSRRRRMGQHQQTIVPPIPAPPSGTGIRTIIAGFAVILLVGMLLLSLPITTAGGERTSFADAFFTAVSSVCVVGLVVVETQGHWNFLGELVIIVLVQIGGLGYMVGTALAAWLMGRRLEIRDRNLLRLYYGAPTMGETLNFARNIAIFTFVVEGIGAIVLFIAFVAEGVAPSTSVWWAIFHSLAAFNNAGFALTGADMFPYRESPAVLLPLSFLIILGSLGALPVLAVGRLRSFDRLPLDHKLVFVMTAILLVGGTLFVLGLEWGNERTLGAVDPVHRPVLAFFQAVVPRTAGFNAVSPAGMHDETLFGTIILMFIGGATGSTAGGAKVGTIALLFLLVVATLRGRDEIIVFRRRIPPDAPARALAVVVLLAIAGFACVTLLTLLEDLPFLDLLYESTSALATTGSSTGITPILRDSSRMILLVTMLLGRFGALVLLLYVTRPHNRLGLRSPSAGVRLG